MTQSEKGYTEFDARIRHATIRGDKYVAGHYFSGLGSGVNANLLLENPSNSATALLTAPPSVTAGKRVQTRLDFNPTQDTAGTQAGIHNRRTDIDDTGVATAEYGGTYTLTDPFDDIPVGEGVGGNNTYAPTDTDEAFVITPDDSALLQATTTTTDTDLRLAINYIQIPTGLL